jgi:signal transduction histidine kinase
MALQLDSLAHKVEDDPRLVERVRALRERMRGTVAEVRRVVDDLRPPALDELGLAGALSEHLSVYSGAAGATTVSLSVDGIPAELPAAIEVAVYRIVAEAVANAVRHGRARCCTVRVGRSDDDVVVEVRDDGRGIPPGARTGVGLSSMRDRAAEIGGSLQLTTGPAGTTVRAQLPLEVRNDTCRDRR